MPELQYFTVPLGGGVNTRDALENLGSDYAVYQFWDNERQGSLTSRNAARRLYIAGGASNPTTLWSTRNTGGTTAWLVTYSANGGVVHTSPALTTDNTLLTWTTAQVWIGADTLNSKLWMVNGADTPQSWDMTTNTTTVATVAAMPVARHIKMYKNYCFVAGTTANPSRVFFSSIKDPTTWPTNNFQDVAPDDGDQITGMYPTPEGLMIFKQTSIWMMIGDTFDATNPQWRLIKLNTYGVGGLGYSTAAFLPGVGVIWLAKDGVYRWNGATVESVSEKIRPTMELLNTYAVGYAATVNGITYNNRREAQGVVFRNRYWLSVEQGSATTNTRTLLVMDTAGNWQISTESTLVGWVNFSDTNYTNRLIGNLYPGRELVEWNVNRSTSAATVSFGAGDARTGYLTMGDPTRLKHFRRCFALYSVDNGFGTMTMTITITPDGDTTRDVTLTFTAANGTAISGGLGDVAHLTETMYRRDVDINIQARMVQLRIQSSVASQTDTRILAALHNLTFEYSTESVHGGALV